MEASSSDPTQAGPPCHLPTFDIRGPGDETGKSHCLKVESRARRRSSDCRGVGARRAHFDGGDFEAELLLRARRKSYGGQK